MLDTTCLQRLMPHHTRRTQRVVCMGRSPLQHACCRCKLSVQLSLQQLSCHAGFRLTAMGADRVLSGDLTHHGANILLDSGAFTDAGSRYRDLNQDYAVREQGCWSSHDAVACPPIVVTMGVIGLRQVLQPVYSQQQPQDRDGSAQQSLIAAVLDGAQLTVLSAGDVTAVSPCPVSCPA